MNDWAIATTHLRKEYGEKVAVQDLTLHMKRGEVFGFLGPNGAGKTTSIKMLLSLVRPTAGQGEILGEKLNSPHVRSRVGYLPEHFRFHDWLRAWEFLDFHGRLYRIPKPKRRAMIPDLLELVGLGERADAKLGTFSKGMTQRIGIAQALMNDPELVFLDEPTSGLDPLGRRLVRDIIDGLRAEGTAVFVNSHLLSEIEKTCDRVAFIRDGEILEINEMADLAQAQLTVELRVGDSQERVAEVLNQHGAGVTFDGENGRWRLHIPDEETLPQLSRALIEDGHNLYEMGLRRVTLEERFLQVIGDKSGDTTS